MPRELYVPFCLTGGDVLSVLQAGPLAIDIPDGGFTSAFLECVLKEVDTEGIEYLAGDHRDLLGQTAVARAYLREALIDLGYLEGKIEYIH